MKFKRKLNRKTISLKFISLTNQILNKQVKMFLQCNFKVSIKAGIFKLGSAEEFKRTVSKLSDSVTGALAFVVFF